MKLSLNIQDIIKKCDIGEIARVARKAGFTAFDYFITFDEKGSSLPAPLIPNAIRFAGVIGTHLIRKVEENRK